MNFVRRPPRIGKAIAGANGVADILLPPDTRTQAQLLERINIASTSTTLTPEVFVYIGDAAVDQNCVDYTPAGKRDVSVNNPAIYVPGTSSLLVRFTGCDVGAECTVRIQRLSESNA